jgi:pimeloyl-ACP methyl ester carboxylesterase
VPDHFTARTVRAGGQRLAYHESGPADGPVVVLLHGLASDAGTWDKAVGPLAGHGLRVIALDLLGHGRSDKPRGEYLLDDFADSLAAFFAALELGPATVCGHSLGGAIAVHFAAAHPACVQRLVLVSAGGLGREVHPLLRAAALPVAPPLLRLAMSGRARRVYRSPAVHRALKLTPDNLVNLRRAARALGSAEGQRSFFASLRGVIEPGGQRGSFIEMETLSPDLPTLIIWNAGDPVIPVAHARAADLHLTGGAPGPGTSRLVVFPDRGHEPHRRRAETFADEVWAFILAS